MIFNQMEKVKKPSFAFQNKMPIVEFVESELKYHLLVANNLGRGSGIHF